MADDLELAPSLMKAAVNWRTYADVTTRPGPAFAGLGSGSGEAVMITRCEACGEEIFPTGENGVSVNDTVRHMVNSHGYRMDGRQFDNQNNQVGHA